MYNERQQTSFSAQYSTGTDLYIRMTPIIDEVRVVDAVVITLSDISELKTTERKRAEILIVRSDTTFGFAVNDQGCAIPESAMPHLFNLYHRVQHPNHKSIKGAGLDLAFVKAIADRHRGEVSVNSNIGGGSTFQFVLSMD